MKLALNKEFARRHLFVTVLMAGLGCWFGYDGLVRYPATDAAVLFRSIEGKDAPPGYDLGKFKRQKTQTQHGFAALALLAAALVGGHLWKVSKFEFEFDDDGFVFAGKRRSFADITCVDRSQWAKKGILIVDGIKLDAWHHTGVKEFVARLDRVQGEKG